MHVAVTGTTGFVGIHLLKVLLEHGCDVRAVVRRVGYFQGLEHFTTAAADVRQPSSLLGSLNDCEAVVHLVGIQRETRAERFDAVHRVGTQAVLREARRAGVGRFVYVSALGAAPEATSRFLRSKWTAEEAVRSSDLDWTILRPSVIFGNGDHFMNRLAQLFMLPVIPVIGNGTTLLQPVGVGDLTQAVVSTLGQAETVGRTYDVVGPDSMPVEAILDVVEGAIRAWHRPRIHIPPGAAMMLARFLAVAPGHVITRDQVPLLSESCVADPGPATRDLDLRGEAFSVAAAREYLAPGGTRRVSRKRQVRVPNDDDIEQILGRLPPVDLRLVGGDVEGGSLSGAGPEPD